MGQYYQGTIKPKQSKVWKGYTSWDFENGAKLMEHSYIGNSFVTYIKHLIFRNPMRVVWAGDYADNENGKELNLFDLAERIEMKDGNKCVPENEQKEMRYLVNYTKKQFVTYSKIKKDNWGFRIDPLPLLTAEGNGRGGGEYWGQNNNLVGTWARDKISVTNRKPSKAYFTELVPNFKE